MYRLNQFKVSLVRDSSELKEGKKRIGNAADIALAAQDMKQLDREQLRVYYLSCRNDIIGWELISQGSLTASIAHPREIFKGAILATCAGIILVHNHPSGNPTPSEDDIRLTKRIADAGRILGIELLDHVIVAEDGSFSFKSSGMI
jgi:DNA repair protein RadC